MSYTLEFNIERLVLEGFSPHDRNRISNSLQLELTRIFREKGIPDSLKGNSEIARMNLGKVKVPSHNKPELIGNKVAQTIYSSFKNG